MRTALLTILLCLCAQAAPAQTVGAEMHFDVSQWANPTRTYMNGMEFGATAYGTWGVVWAEGTASWRWWGSRKAKIMGSLWNLEANKVLERRRWLSVGTRHAITDDWVVRLGWTIGRRAVHHIWRLKDRHEHFPGGWQIGIEGCKGQATPSHPAGEGCASLGYYDLTAPLVRVSSQWLEAQVGGPSVTWKTLTLPYPRWRGYVDLEPNEWRLSVDWEAAGPAGLGYDAEVSRSIPSLFGLPEVPFVRLGVRASDHLPDPGWGRGEGDNLTRLAFVLMVEVER